MYELLEWESRSQLGLQTHGGRDTNLQWNISPFLLRSLFSQDWYWGISRPRIILVSPCFSTFVSLALSAASQPPNPVLSWARSGSRVAWHLVAASSLLFSAGYTILRTFMQVLEVTHLDCCYALHMDTPPSCVWPTQFTRHFRVYFRKQMRCYSRNPCGISA